MANKCKFLNLALFYVFILSEKITVVKSSLFISNYLPKTSARGIENWF